MSRTIGLKLRHLTIVSCYLGRALLLAFSVPALVPASPVMSVADVFDGKSWSFSISGQSIEKEPILEIAGTNAVQVPVSGGSNTIFSASNAEVETEENCDSVVAMLVVKPREGLHYNFKLGQIQNFDLEFSSGSQTNKLEALKNGMIWGFGLGGLIAPGSIVSTAISWELGYSQKTIDVDRFESGTNVSPADIQFEEVEYQGLVNFSRRWKTLEPYGGIKILRTVAKLKDEGTKEQVSGTTDGVSPFVGLQWSFADREMLVVEGSFVEEESFSAAIKIQF